MKNKIVKILGLVVTLATLMSLFVSAAPVSAATQEWSSVATPSNTGFVVSDAAKVTINRVGQMVYNSDKSVIYATALINDAAAPGYSGMAIFKSTNSGRTWSRVNISAYHAEIAANSGYIFDIVTSPTNVNELYFTDGYEIYTSKDAGATWTKLSNMFVWAAANGWVNAPVHSSPVNIGTDNMIVTLDLAQYGTTKLVFAGTARFAGPNASNKVAVCTESDFGMPWNDLGVLDQRVPAPFATGNVWDVKVDPTDFAVKQGVFAVVTAGTGHTYVTAKYMGNQWNQAALCKDAEILVDNNIAKPITAPYHAEIWLPSDFNSNLSSGKFQAWIALSTRSNQGDVYMWIGGTSSSVVDLNVAGAGTATEVTDIDGYGPISGARLIIGGYDAEDPADAGPFPNVWYSADGFGFTKNVKRPTGQYSWYGSECTVLALSDYATSGRALAGTGGLGGAVSYTQDYGKTFNQISLMRANVASLLDMGSWSNGFYIITTSSAGIESIWKQVTVGGTNYWERIWTELWFANYASPSVPLAGHWDVEASPDGILFLADVGGVRIWRSSDNGLTWGLQFNDITSAGGTTISAWMPVGASSVLVGGTDKVYVTTTNGIVWFAYTCSVGTITDFAVSGSTWFAAGVSGGNTIKVAKSTNSGATWTTLNRADGATATIGSLGVAKAYVEAAADYATSGNVFVASDKGGVWRYPSTASTSGWIQVDGNGYDYNGDVASAAGLVVGEGGPGSTAEGSGMVYVTDKGAAGEGVSRIRGLSTEAESLMQFGVTFNGLWLTKSGTDNVLWTMGSDNKIYTYTDTLNKAGSGVAQFGTATYYGTAIYGLDLGFPLGAFSAVVKWNALPNAYEYAVYVSDDVDDLGLYDLYWADYNGFYNVTSQTQQVITPLAPNSTYYVSVWAVSEKLGTHERCSSFLFDKQPLPLVTPPAVPNWTPNLSPMSGAQNVQVGPTPFDWDDVPGATGYEFQIAEGTDIPAGTAITTLTTSQHSIPNLKNSTFYTWRVRAVTGSVKGDWVTSVFSTAAATQPPVTITQTAQPAPSITLTVPQPSITLSQPAITVTIPPGTTTAGPTLVLPEAETPAYIWIIVAVGAVLTIAVIVLIIRTRRVV